VSNKPIKQPFAGRRAAMQQKQFANSREAREMLLRLEEFYNEPVLPLHHFCRAMELWFECIAKNNTDPALRRHDREQGYDYFKFLNHMRIDIRKSNLLGRLLYGKEPLRTRMCPVHKGHYNGEAMFFTACRHTCDGTGWLRERESDRGYTGISVHEAKFEDGEFKIKDRDTGEWKKPEDK